MIILIAGNPSRINTSSQFTADVVRFIR